MELLRVVHVDGRAIPDPRRRMPGRGAWLHPDPECLAKAEKRRAFPRAFRVQGVLDVAGLRSAVEAAVVGGIGAGHSRSVEENRKQVDPS
ncbi:YlxR family protein [Actinokineospora inagensis]|uniref:YlxR family protein n=1 Tax=Actinokineospora inagensis TaxID=103730 RepID=UPI001FE1C99A